MQPLKNENRPYAVVEPKNCRHKNLQPGGHGTVRVQYHWVGTPATAETSAAPPCNYFNDQSTQNLAQPTLVYKLSGSDWKLVEIS